MSSFTGFMLCIADLAPWAICVLAIVLNGFAIFANHSKASSLFSFFSSRCDWLTSTDASASKYVQMLPVSTLVQRDGTDPLMEVLKECAAKQQRKAAAEKQGVRPLLTFVRDLSIAEALKTTHCEAALTHMAEQGDTQGVHALLLIITSSGIVVTNNMVTESLLMLCNNGGDLAAVQISRTIRAGCPSDYFLDSRVLEALILSAGRLSMQSDVESIFKHLLTVARPSARAYGLMIHALGSHGAINDAVNLFEDVMAKNAKDGEDVSIVWNSLLGALARNNCVRRAVGVFEKGRAENLNINRAVALALCKLAPDLADPRVWFPPEKMKMSPMQRKKQRGY